MTSHDELVYSFPLHKKLFLFLCCLFLSGIAYFSFISGDYLLIFLGLLILSLAIFGVYKILTISNVITVTKEGIVPHAVLKSNTRHVIPWNNIKDVYVAKQRGRNISEEFLTLQLFDTESLDQNQTSTQNFLDTLNVTVKAQMSDKSSGDIYLSVRMLNKSAKEIINEIRQFRSQHEV